MGASSKLLIAEHPLQVLPSLAVAIGLNEAMFVQQLHYWHKRKEEARDTRYFRDGRWWNYNTYEEWQEQFPFWSVETVKRVVRSAEKAGYVVSTSGYNERKGDQTKWYAIDHEALDRAGEGSSEEPEDVTDEAGPMWETPRATGQFDPPNVSNCPPQQVNLTRPLPETNAETNAETTSDDDRASETPRAPEPKGEDFVDVFWSSLSAARGTRNTPLDDQRPVTKKVQQSLERDAEAELAAGRDPERLKLAAMRMGLRWDEYRLDLAEAIGDVKDGKPWSVEQEGAGRGVPAGREPPVSGGDGAKRRREGYEWLFD
ncbi:MAG: hypothetical protein M3P49_16420 [Actinomycetota bacterium]|nr:hypothetical protein [Actinomycetota bacterium]